MDVISQTTLSNAFSWILINILLKFVPKGLIYNTLALVQMMAWRRPGDKPLSEPIMVNLLTHICVTRPQWVKCLTFTRFCNLHYTHMSRILRTTYLQSHPCGCFARRYDAFNVQRLTINGSCFCLMWLKNFTECRGIIKNRKILICPVVFMLIISIESINHTACHSTSTND